MMLKRVSKAEAARLKAAPVEFAGQWVAWNRERTEIVAHGPDFATAYNAAKAAGHLDAVFQKVGRPGVSFIGAT